MGGASTQTRDLPQTLAVAMMLMTVLIVIDTTNKKCGASSVTDTIWWKSNDTNNIMEYEDLETEFQMDSEISRRILRQGTYVTSDTFNSNKAVMCGQARNSPYRCGAPGSGGKPPNCRDIYDRGCIRR